MIELTEKRLARFWRHVRVNFMDSRACWEWDGRLRNGYGVMSQRGAGESHHTEPAHRIMYRLRVGPIPDGMEVDHTCHNADHGRRLHQGLPLRRVPCCSPRVRPPVPSRTHRNESRGAAVTELPEHRELPEQDRNEERRMSCPNCPPGYDCERGLYVTTRPADPTFKPGWLQEQVARSVAMLDSLPPKLRASLGRVQP